MGTSSRNMNTKIKKILGDDDNIDFNVVQNKMPLILREAFNEIEEKEYLKSNLFNLFVKNALNVINLIKNNDFSSLGIDEKLKKENKQEFANQIINKVVNSVNNQTDDENHLVSTSFKQSMKNIILNENINDSSFYNSFVNFFIKKITFGICFEPIIEKMNYKNIKDIQKTENKINELIEKAGNKYISNKLNNINNNEELLNSMKNLKKDLKTIDETTTATNTLPFSK